MKIVRIGPEPSRFQFWNFDSYNFKKSKSFVSSVTLAPKACETGRLAEVAFRRNRHVIAPGRKQARRVTAG